MKKITKFKDQKILVLGLARSGMAAALVLNELGAIVTVNDGKPFEENKEAQLLLEEGIKVITGSHPIDLLDEDFALMVKNPGIRYDNPMVERAEALNIPVITEVELAYLISEAPIIGITGTNGKTTTTTLIADILNADGQSAKLSGNIGFPASEVAQKAQATDTLVMELSSFQLMGIDSFRPKIALITNLFSAHLDYHGSQKAYEAAKWRIQENMTSDDFLILNFNQEKCRNLADKTKATVLAFSTKEKVNGAYSKDGKIYFNDEYIMEVSELSLPGEHNLENALAAIVASKLQGTKNEAIVEVLTSFAGVKHRLQYLGEIDGRKVYNDSKATNILATQKALSGFDNSKVILIAGGLDRGNEFDELIPDITGLKKMVILGESAPRVKRAADKAGVTYLDAKDVADATRIAFEQASAGDVVLLSPANASWDMYKNFEVRGDEFITTVERLKG